MKKAFALIPLLLLCLQLCSQATEITFDQRAWNEILAQAKQENKMVFVDANTSWCGPCKWMAATTFKNPDIAALFNTNFVNAKIDMEKGEGPELRAKYGVQAFPTLIFVDGDGNMVHSQEGALDVAELKVLAQTVLDPNFNSLVKMSTRFDGGERGRAFLKDYLIRLSPNTPAFNKVLEPFKPGMVAEGLLEENSWEVFETCYQNPFSDCAQYFLGHRQAFESKYGQEPVQKKAYQLYLRMGELATNNSELSALQEAKRVAASSGLRNADALVCRIQLNWYRSKQDVPNYIATCNELFKTPEGAADIGEKNFQALIVSRGCDKKEELRPALKWSQDVLRVQQDYSALRNMALLQLKLGKIKPGMATAEKAIAAAKAEGEEYDDMTTAMETYGSKKAKP